MTWLLSANEFEVTMSSRTAIRGFPGPAGFESATNRRVHVLRVQALDNGFQSAEQQVEVQGGCRPVHRYLWEPTGSIFVDPGLSASSRKRSPVQIEITNLRLVPVVSTMSRPASNLTSTLRSGCSDTSSTVPTRIPRPARYPPF